MIIYAYGSKDTMENNIERWYFLEEMMEHLGVSRDTIMKWIDTKNMPVVKIGRLWKFKVNEVDAWMKTIDNAEN